MIALTVLLLTSLVVSRTSATTPITFGRPVVAIPYPGTVTKPGMPEPTSEPQMLIAKDGRILVAAQFEMWDCRTRRPLANTGVTYQGFGTDEQRLCVWASNNGGRTFHIIGGDCCQNGDDVSLAQTVQSLPQPFQLLRPFPDPLLSELRAHLPWLDRRAGRLLEVSGRREPCFLLLLVSPA